MKREWEGVRPRDSGAYFHYGMNRVDLQTFIVVYHS